MIGVLVSGGDNAALRAALMMPEAGPAFCCSKRRLTIRARGNCRDWMRRHGVHFQPPLSGTL